MEQPKQIQINQHLCKTVRTKTKHYFHKGSLISGLLDCI